MSSEHILMFWSVPVLPLILVFTCTAAEEGISWLRAYRPGTQVVVCIFCVVCWPIALLILLTKLAKRCIQDILLDSRRVKGFEGATASDYEKALQELIQMNPAAALISDNKQLRARAESILGSTNE